MKPIPVHGYNIAYGPGRVSCGAIWRRNGRRCCGAPPVGTTLQVNETLARMVGGIVTDGAGVAGVHPRASHSEALAATARAGSTTATAARPRGSLVGSDASPDGRTAAAFTGTPSPRRLL